MVRLGQIILNKKQMIVINATLKFSAESLSVQIARASAGALVEADQLDQKIWLKAGCPRVVLKVFGEEDLQDFLSKAEQRRLPIYRVNTDASLGGNLACVGIGPVCDMQIEQLKMVLDFYGWVRQNAMNARLFG